MSSELPSGRSPRYPNIPISQGAIEFGHSLLNTFPEDVFRQVGKEMADELAELNAILNKRNDTPEKCSHEDDVRVQQLINELVQGMCRILSRRQ